MNLSGIAVLAAAHNAESVARALAALPGVQVQQVDPASGRIVLVQEAAEIAAEVDGFRAIQRTPGVISADLICHYFGEQPTAEPDLARVLARLDATTRCEPSPADCTTDHDLHNRGIR